MVVALPVTISQFSSDPNVLNLKLWDKQAEILEEFWAGNYAIAVWALGRRSGKTLIDLLRESKTEGDFRINNCSNQVKP